MDNSLSGSKTGTGGDTGWMFTSQTDVLLNVQPDTFVLEMVANALKVDPAAVDKIVDIMSEKYDVQREVLRVAEHGDESNRERLFIVGVHNRLQAPKGIFKFPEPMHGHSRTARDIAVPDQEVPRRYWKRIHGIKPRDRMYKRTPGHLNKLVQLATGMGHSSMPHAVYTWDGTFNT